MKQSDLNQGLIETSGGLIAARTVWKRLSLVTSFTNAREFREALKKAGRYMTTCCGQVIDKWPFEARPEAREVQLVNVSAANLGLTTPSTRSDINKRANELGLGLCPNDIGLQLACQYGDQPRNEWLHMGMKPFADSDGDFCVFCIGCDENGESWLITHDSGDPDKLWDIKDRWVFLRID